MSGETSMTQASTPSGSESRATKDVKEKRKFFRIYKDVVFDYKCVDADTAEHGEAREVFESSAHLTLLNRLKTIDRDQAKSLKLIADKNRLLGDYLTALNQKIDLVAQHLLFSENDNDENEEIEKHRTRVNLSEDGIAFISSRTLYKGSFVALRLVFLPSYTMVASFAKILRCEQKDRHYQAAAQFYRMGDIEQQEISREIIKAQMLQKRSGVAQ